MNGNRVVIGLVLKPNQKKDATNALKALRVLDLDISSIYDIDIDNVDDELEIFSDILSEQSLESLIIALPKLFSDDTILGCFKLPVYYNNDLYPVNLPSNCYTEESIYARLLVINEVSKVDKHNKSIYNTTNISIVVDTVTLDFCYVLFNSIIYSSNTDREWDLGNLFWDYFSMSGTDLKPMHTLHCDYSVRHSELKKYMDNLIKYSYEEKLIYNNTCYIFPDYKKSSASSSCDFSCIVENGVKDVIFNAKSIMQFEIVVPPNTARFSILCSKSSDNKNKYKVYVKKESNIYFNLYIMYSNKIISGNKDCDEIKEELSIEYY